MRFSGKSVASIGVAVVGFLVFAGGALAQSYDRLAQAQPAPAQPAPAQPAQAQPIWGVNCAGTPNGLDCRAIQAMQMTNTGVMSLAVRVPPETKKPLLILLLPMGIYLPAGVTVRFGQDAAKTVQLQSCDTTGCLAELALTEAEIAAMLKGQGLTLSVQSQDKQPVSVQVPATGFSAAYAKIK